MVPKPRRFAGTAMQYSINAIPCIIRQMLRIALVALTLSFATLSHGAEPALNNERVTVWDKGTAYFGHQGDAPGKTAVRTVIVEPKDHPLPSIANCWSAAAATPSLPN